MTKEVSSAWRDHVAEVQRHIAALQTRAAVLKGSLYDTEKTIEQLQSYMGLIVTPIALSSGLLPEQGPFTLSADGTSIQGKDPTKE